MIVAENKLLQDTKGDQDGFSLIEAMIASIVLTVGLLALAGMQSIALIRNIDAHETSRVTSLAADMIERIEFNRKNASAYNNINTKNSGTRPPTTQPMARGDYTQWAALLTASGLQNVQGLVTVASSGPTVLNSSLVTVQIIWTSLGKGETSVQLSHSMFVSTVITPE